MAYNFFSSNQIRYGVHSQLYANTDLSVGVWIKLLAGVGGSTTSLVLGVERGIFSFTNFRMDIKVPGLFVNPALGYGVEASHIAGGSFQAGVTCRPGEIHPTYAWGLNKWMYFGFTRDYGAAFYYSYFGTRTLIVAGQTASFGGIFPPLGLGSGGFPNGSWFLGQSSGGSGLELGPMTLWSRTLIFSEHELLSKCLMPSTSHLELKVNMDASAADTAPNMWPNTFVGSPLYVADTPCQPFGAGSDYSLTSP